MTNPKPELWVTARNQGTQPEIWVPDHVRRQMAEPTAPLGPVGYEVEETIELIVPVGAQMIEVEPDQWAPAEMAEPKAGRRMGFLQADGSIRIEGTFITPPNP